MESSQEVLSSSMTEFPKTKDRFRSHLLEEKIGNFLKHQDQRRHIIGQVPLSFRGSLQEYFNSLVPLLDTSFSRLADHQLFVGNLHVVDKLSFIVAYLALELSDYSGAESSLNAQGISLDKLKTPFDQDHLSSHPLFRILPEAIGLLFGRPQGLEDLLKEPLDQHLAVLKDRVGQAKMIPVSPSDYVTHINRTLELFYYDWATHLTLASEQRTLDEVGLQTVHFLENRELLTSRRPDWVYDLVFGNYLALQAGQRIDEEILSFPPLTSEPMVNDLLQEYYDRLLKRALAGDVIAQGSTLTVVYEFIKSIRDRGSLHITQDEIKAWFIERNLSFDEKSLDDVLVVLSEPTYTRGDPLSKQEFRDRISRRNNHFLVDESEALGLVETMRSHPGGFDAGGAFQEFWKTSSLFEMRITPQKGLAFSESDRFVDVARDYIKDFVYRFYLFKHGVLKRSPSRILSRSTDLRFVQYPGHSRNSAFRDFRSIELIGSSGQDDPKNILTPGFAAFRDGLGALPHLNPEDYLHYYILSIQKSLEGLVLPLDDIIQIGTMPNGKISSFIRKLRQIASSPDVPDSVLLDKIDELSALELSSMFEELASFQKSRLIDLASHAQYVFAKDMSSPSLSYVKRYLGRKPFVRVNKLFIHDKTHPYLSRLEKFCFEETQDELILFLPPFDESDKAQQQFFTDLARSLRATEEPDRSLLMSQRHLTIDESKVYLKATLTNLARARTRNNLQIPDGTSNVPARLGQAILPSEYLLEVFGDRDSQFFHNLALQARLRGSASFVDALSDRDIKEILEELYVVVQKRLRKIKRKNLHAQEKNLRALHHYSLAHTFLSQANNRLDSAIDYDTMRFEFNQDAFNNVADRTASCISSRGPDAVASLLYEIDPTIFTPYVNVYSQGEYKGSLVKNMVFKGNLLFRTEIMPINSKTTSGAILVVDGVLGGPEADQFKHEWMRMNYLGLLHLASSLGCETLLVNTAHSRGQQSAHDFVLHVARQNGMVEGRDFVYEIEDSDGIRKFRLLDEEASSTESMKQPYTHRIVKQAFPPASALLLQRKDEQRTFSLEDFEIHPRLRALHQMNSLKGLARIVVAGKNQRETYDGHLYLTSFYEDECERNPANPKPHWVKVHEGIPRYVSALETNVKEELQRLLHDKD
ncbi:MAG: hypothetical protein H6502_01710 [Candidatus Woesearchaeota archaeon]|nr:MAG: hypothetical protein H6502_01710 [Candidatus Woesearchaeota archaeon]